VAEQVTRREGAPGSRCPYCHDDLPAVVDAAACDRCGARHHVDCWLGRCASCLQPGQESRPAPGRSPLVLLVCAGVAVAPTLLLVRGLLAMSRFDPESEFLDLALVLATPIVALLLAALWFVREAWRAWSVRSTR
jgi:hypothetical protein